VQKVVKRSLRNGSFCTASPAREGGQGSRHEAQELLTLTASFYMVRRIGTCREGS